jgi:hypothetical protein
MINKYNSKQSRADTDITINELPKADVLNNSDLMVVQGVSFTEATSIQNLRTKILGGADSVTSGLGSLVFSPTVNLDPNYVKMDGSSYSPEMLPDFFDFLKNQPENIQQLFNFNTVTGLTIPDYNSLTLKVNNVSGGNVTRTEGVATHNHNIKDLQTLSKFWVNENTGTKPANARLVAVKTEVGDSTTEGKIYTNNPANPNTNVLLNNDVPNFEVFCYIKVANSSQGLTATPFIKSDGSVAMDLDYEPFDLMDVATKKYIDKKFLDTPLPLSFSIDDIGKVIPYYHKADSNQTLIALDGTKYLITDYPDFDFQNIKGVPKYQFPQGSGIRVLVEENLFNWDETHFWYKNIVPKIIIKNYGEREGNLSIGESGQFASMNSQYVNSKLLYNWLQLPESIDFINDSGSYSNAGNFIIITGAEPEVGNEEPFTKYGAYAIILPQINTIDNPFPPAEGAKRKNYTFTNGDKLVGLAKTINGENQERYPLYEVADLLTGVEAKDKVDADGGLLNQPLALPLYIQVKPDYMVARLQQVGGSSNIVISEDVNFNGFKAINLGEPTNPNDSARLVDLNSDNIIVSDGLVISDGLDSRVVKTLTQKLEENDLLVNDMQLVNSSQSAKILDNTNAITEIESNLTDINTIIQSQAAIINDLTTKLNSFDTKYRSFTSKFVKSGLNVTINSNVNILTNLTKYFIASQNPTITAFGSSISGLPLGAINLIEVGTGANQGFRFPVINGIINCNLTFTIRVTGDISGSAGTPRELIVYLRRVSDNSLVANGGIIKVNDNNFNARSVIVPSFIQGANDPFYTGGFYLDLLNKSGGDLKLTSIELLIQG